MKNVGKSGFAGWLEAKSINQRLAVQVRTGLLLSAVLILTIAVGSWISLGMNGRNAQLGDQALYAALLEKDFASTERDVFRHGLLRTEQSKADYQGNIKDLLTSIEDTRGRLGENMMPAADTVSKNADAYIEAVEAALGSGSFDGNAEKRVAEVGGALDDSIEAIREPAIAEAEEMHRKQERTVHLVMAITILVAILAGLLSLIFARGIKRAISDELETVSSAIDSIARGKLDVDIPYAERDDQLGALARAAIQLRETSRAKQQSDAELERMAQTVGESLRKMAAGDLTVELPNLGAGYSGLRSDFNSTISQLHETISSVNDAAQDIRSGAKEINQASSDLAQRTEQHAAELAHAAESVDAITRSLQESAGIASQANDGVIEAVNEARQGGEVVGQAVNAMANIENSSAEISQIINVIDGIAFQTNLLALNAGVEAARAGDAGKGFAVVASEVRALAQRSADAAKDIKALITTSSGEVEAGARMVRQAGEALEQISARINGISEMVTYITGAASDQSQKLAEINMAMSKMDHVTQQNAAMVEQSTAAARSLLEEADGLTDRVGRFNCRSERGTARAEVRPMQQTVTPRKAPAPVAMPAVSGNLALSSSADAAEDDWAEF